jgi:iron complex outermembrane recepter protein
MMKNARKIIRPQSKALAAAVAGITTALAFPVDAQVLEEVVVTAQKRAESIQDVPLSIMAFSNATLERAGVRSADELTKIVPNLQINRQAQASATAIRMRGIGSVGNNSIDPSVAPFIDGVYIARPGAILNSFLDVAGVEVLRGPQGTLFGRNATTGAIQISTNAPDFSELGGEVVAEAGNYDAYRLRGVVNVPVSDTFALRFAALTDQRDGYFDNLLDGESYGDRDANVARASARWQPNDSLDWTVRLDYAEMGGDGALPPEVSTHTSPPELVAILGSAFGPLSPSVDDPFDGTVNQLINADLDDEQWGISSDLNYDFANGYRVRWIGAAREWENYQLDSDVVYTGVDLVGRRGSYESESMSQEVQLISPDRALFNERMDFVLGLFYFEEDYRIGETLDLGSAFCGALLPPALAPSCQPLPRRDATVLTFDQTAESTAAFVETNWHLSDTLKLKLGGRYTKDEKSALFEQVVNNPFAAGLRAPEVGSYDFDDDQFNYRVVLSWFPTEEVMFFANYSTGYKAGGINSSGVASSLEGRRIFTSEEVEDIELGIKSTLLEGAMQLNLTGYRMEIDDFQDRSFQDASFLVTNAGSLRQQGVELEAKWLPSNNLSIDFAAAYLDSEFTDFEDASPLAGCAVLPPPGTPACPNPQDNTGSSASYSPEWEVTAAAEHVLDFSNGMRLTSRVDYRWVDDYLAGGSDLSRQYLVESFDIWGARLTLEPADSSWAISLYGENLTDERYALQHFTQVLGGALGLLDTETGDTVMRHYLSAPRTYGVSVKYAF